MANAEEAKLKAEVARLTAESAAFKSALTEVDGKLERMDCELEIRARTWHVRSPVRESVARMLSTRRASMCSAGCSASHMNITMPRQRP